MKEGPQQCRVEPTAGCLFAGPGEMRDRGRALDWSATALGSVETWSPTLRAAVRLCLDGARPMCVFAGPELVAIYNDAYATAVGSARHPATFARPARDGWGDLWDQIGPEYEQVMAGGPAVERLEDGRYVTDRGRGPEETYWTYATSAIRDDDGQVVGCHTLITETTQRVQTEAALRASDERFRTMTDIVPDLLWQSEPDGWTAWYNARWGEYTGQTLEQSLGWGWTEAIHPDDRARSAANYARAAEQGETLVQQHRIRRRDGAYRWFLVRAEPLRNETGRIVRWFGAATDVHAQRMALEEAERLATERTAERDALRLQLGEAEEAERRRLARELHDQLGQQITAIALGLEDAGRRAEACGEEALLARLTQLKVIARSMSMSARYVALELRPPELDDVGLASALETYVREWSARYGVEADAVASGDVRRPVPADAATALYRIAQEALTNVAKHAAATHVSVIVDKPNGELRLLIEDDGRGFDVADTIARAPRERRLGLAGMQERVALLGGDVAVESTPSLGTTIFVRVPVNDDPSS